MWPPNANGHDGPAETIPVAYQGKPVGEIVVTKPPNDPLTPGESELLDDLARQAGLALHNVRLTDELALRLQELAEQSAQLQISRQRLVTARDAQRRGLERDIRDGPERRLIEIGHRVREATSLVERDAPAAEELLDRLGEDANTTLEGLRDLARGIFPPLLADQGIVPALEAHIRKVGARATVEASPTFRRHRFDADTEACVYFCCLQAIQNVIRHAGNAPCTVHLDLDDVGLIFSVRDEGPGFDASGIPPGMGRQIMQDRVDALDGGLAIDAAPGRGTTVTIQLPLPVAEAVT
jgi:signal transduction histidine kinase